MACAQIPLTHEHTHTHKHTNTCIHSHTHTHVHTKRIHCWTAHTLFSLLLIQGGRLHRAARGEGVEGGGRWGRYQLCWM